MIKRSRDWGVPCRPPSLVQFCGVVHNLGEIHLVGSPDGHSFHMLSSTCLLRVDAYCNILQVISLLAHSWRCLRRIYEW